MELGKRAVCYDSYYGRRYNCNSGWYSWGRWVVFGIIVLAAFVLFFLFACMSARRRRKRGLQPYRGLGWAATPWGHGPAQYNPNYQEQGQQWQQQPGQWNQPPQYTPAGGYYGNQQPQPGNFGGQGQNNVELQQPNNTYRGGDNVYEPPTGPPPGKKDEPIR